MKKRIISLTLALSIVMGLFGIANFGAFAATNLTADVDYTISGFNKNTDFTFDPADNLLNNVSALSHYWYNVEEGDNTIALASTPKQVTDGGWLNNLGFATASDNMYGEGGSTTTLKDCFAPSGWIAQQMFIKSVDGNIASLDKADPETQWYQVNYKLPSKSSITDVTISNLGKTNDALDKWTPQSYEYIFADTFQGLISGEGATTVLVDHTSSTIKNVTTVTLGTPITAKYVAIRFYQPYNDIASGANWTAFKTSNMYGRWDRFDVHGTQLADSEYTNYTFQGDNTATSLDGTGKDPAKSLIVDKIPSSAQVFNDVEMPGVLGKTNGVLEYSLATDTTVPLLTSATDFTTDSRIFPSDTMASYTYNMFAEWSARNSTGKITALINDETKQWAQINYTLDGEASINTFVLAANSSSINMQMPGHYKIIFSDTEEGLRDHEKAKAVIELDERENASLKSNRHIVKLNTPVTAKYVGIRFICMFNSTAVDSVRTYNQMYTHRIKHLSFFGEYTTPATLPNVSASATSKDTDGNTVEGITSTATAGYVGNCDDSGDYAMAGINLTTAGNTQVGNKYYEFKGWYLGNEKVADTATAEYSIKGNEQDLTFEAKYLQTYKPFSDYTAVGDNSKSAPDAATSLLVGKFPEGYYYNGLEGHHNLGKTEAPTKFDVKSTAEGLTSANPTSADCGIFDDLSLSWYMFKTYDSENKVNGLINDETKQWAQLNYTLDGEATISKITFGNFRGSYFWQSFSHYKLILSDTEEGLMDFNLAKAVIDVDMDKNPELKAGMQVVTINTPVTAKYVAIRFICTANSAIIGQSISIMYTDRMNYFGVQGTYTNPVKAEVKVETESGIPSYLVGKQDPVYVGAGDANGNYTAGSIKVVAYAEYQDRENVLEYTFKGWYNGDALVSNDAEYVYDLKGGDITFTAKYDVAPLIEKYTVIFEDGAHNEIERLTVRHGEQLDADLVNQIVVKDFYGYNVLRDGDGNVIWNSAIDSVIVGDITFTALYDARDDLKTEVTIYDVDKTILHKGTHDYDTAFVLSSPNANSWLDADGNVLIVGSSGYLYACGDKIEIYASEKTVVAPEVVIVGKVNEADKGFSVFAHVNVENVTERGVIFASAKAGATKDFSLEDAKDNTDSYSIVEISTNNIGLNTAWVEFMATLNYTDNPTRYARAYIKVGNTYYYSNIVKNK